MITPDRTHIDTDEHPFDLEELIHVEETCVPLFISFKTSTLTFSY